MERASREIWAKRVERWQDSGLTAKEFAAELDVSAGSLTFWKWKLKRQREEVPAPVRRKRRPLKREVHAAQFLQLVPTASSRPASTLEVVLGSGVIIRVAQDFDDATLLRLVTALGGG
jgi:transposase